MGYVGNLSNLISSEEERNREEHIFPLTGTEIPVRLETEINNLDKRKMWETKTPLLLIQYLIHTKINRKITFSFPVCGGKKDGKTGF